MTAREPSRYAINDHVALRGSRALYRVIHVYHCGLCYQVLEEELFSHNTRVVHEDDIIGNVEKKVQ